MAIYKNTFIVMIVNVVHFTKRGPQESDNSQLISGNTICLSLPPQTRYDSYDNNLS